VIETVDDVARGMKALRRACPVMRRIHDVAGDPPLRRRDGGLAGLARIVVGQQVSVASAEAIWGRFETVFTPLSAARLTAAGDADFRAAGLSAPKIRTLRAIAAAMDAGLDLDALSTIEEAEARARLTAVSGIGPWTADIYLMFCVGRADVFAPGDLALQVAWQWAAGLDERPDAKAMAEIAERWRPWRGVAARMLWAFYAHEKKQRSGLPV
jgi:DNA-3-methyladenine glycosylase II